MKDTFTRRLIGPALFVAGTLVGSAITLPVLAMPQPHMQSALSDLQAAAAQLQAAEHDKGGWRERALTGVRNAIRETRWGIAAGNRR